MGQNYGGHWIRTSRRWAVYLRGGLRCLYCLRGLEEILEDGSFLTVDHVRPLVGGGRHDADNLVPACHACNSIKEARRTLQEIADAMGINYSTLRNRLHAERSKSLDHYMPAARLLLGCVSGVPKAEIVYRNDYAARGHFKGMPEDDGEDRPVQGSFWCETCGRLHDDERDDGVPF